MKYFLHCLEISCFLMAGLHFHDGGRWLFVGFVVAGWLLASFNEGNYYDDH